MTALTETFVGDRPEDPPATPLPPLAHFGLIALDMDSTLITIECIDEIADMQGLKEKVDDERKDNPEKDNAEKDNEGTANPDTPADTLVTPEQPQQN